jgi:type I restriction enzyme M protein
VTAHLLKANVLFFDAQPAAKEPWTKEIWYFDYRTNIHHTLKKNPLKLEDLRDKWYEIQEKKKKYFCK